ncbi:MAG TPA: UDP-N-acetylmuramoyl-L-alanyl-D-glutamate--2,6-diaminopimelate ligase [Gemmatimonadaceae bacterium]|nr:UDP-N-acetylmuramoyl-L-alanyl-D-glutamate--2,6-diaminopimelate ligase [Gemmatimonadaceae bacterium]
MTIPIERITAALSAANLLVEVRGELPSAVSDVTDDSRRVAPGGLFIAVKGSERDGHAYLAGAKNSGAAVAIVEDARATTLPAIVVRNGRVAAATAAAAAFDFPVRQLRLVGVTGTNGKSTTVHIIRHLLDRPDARASSIGTVGVLVGSEGTPLLDDPGLTTPGPVELQRILRQAADAGVRDVAMEVSSHALDQRRVDGIAFETVVFTNLTRDHLDYHKTMDAYLAAKVRLMEHLTPHGTIVVNADDPAWRALATNRRRVSFSTRIGAEVHASSIAFSPTGSTWRLAIHEDAETVHLPLIGDFNVSNALGAAGAAYALGMRVEEIGRRLSSVPQVPGRLEVIHRSPTVLRDYAHTPDALERAIAAVRPFTKGQLITVFGCGGDRDKGKRPQMGAVAERLSDHVIVTSDNPRTEDPEKIIDDIEAGMTGGKHERIEDRRAAIGLALERAGAGDVVLLAGKGHENYQIRGTEKLPFDERVIVADLAGARA